MTLRAFLFFLACICVVPVTAALAQSQHKQLIQLVEKLQASPGDDALREQIIKLARKVKPAPAIPEEARQHFVKGITLAQTAKTAAGQELAVKAFQEALKIAPWWGDAYYNLAVAQELAGQLDVARSSLKFYLLTNPGETESREAQDRIYALEAKQELAKAESTAAKVAAEADTPQKREERFLDALEGAIFSSATGLISANSVGQRETHTRTDIIVRDRQLIFSGTWWFPGQSEPALNQGEVHKRVELTGMVVTHKSGPAECGPFTLTISDDGNRITETGTCFGGPFAWDYVRVN